MTRPQAQTADTRAETSQGAHARDRRVAAARDRLALLYQPLLVAVVRVHSGRETVPDAASFRKRVKAALQEVERNATTLNCDFQDIQDAHLAVVSFLDEVVLGCGDALRSEWMRLPMAQEQLGQGMAGEVFFERLEGLLRSRKDSSELADLLEVYLLCLLLGFEGKYSGQPAELRGVMERARSRIEGIRHERGMKLSPDGDLPEEQLARNPPSPGSRWAWVPVASTCGVVIVFLAYWLTLYFAVGRAEALLLGN